MQVYRGLPILTNQAPARLVGIWPLDHEGSVAEYQRLAHAAVDEILAAGRTPVVVGGTGLYLRAALAELELPPAPQEGSRGRWQAFYDAEGGGDGPSSPRRARRRCGRAHPSERSSPSRAGARARGGGAVARTARGPALGRATTRHPTLIVGLEVPKDVLEQRIEARTQAMFESGVEEEVRAALSEPLSATARKVMGLDEVAGLPREQAIEALIVRTRRYAAYQRKWMRRIPGLVMVAANRPPEETADAILEVARARQQLPAAGAQRAR